MPYAFSRTERVIGPEALEKLRRAHVAVFGIGGVGGYVVEALARSGVGNLDLVDDDKVCLTNLNRQIIATHETMGMYKVDAAAQRVKSINPGCYVRTHRCFYLPELREEFDFSRFDYVVDAIDTVTAKLSLIREAQAAGTPILCAMGTGNKLDPSALRIGDLYETDTDPLARVMRKECRRMGVERLKVLYSVEKPIRPLEDEDSAQELAASGRRQIPGSTAFVPAAGGLLIAAEVVKDLTGFTGEGRRVE